MALLAFIFAERDGNAKFTRATEPRVAQSPGFPVGGMWYFSYELCSLIEHLVSNDSIPVWRQRLH